MDYPRGVSASALRCGEPFQPDHKRVNGRRMPVAFKARKKETATRYKVQSLSAALLCAAFACVTIENTKTGSRIVTFDSKLVISKDRSIAVSEKIEIANGTGFFDHGFHRRLKVGPARKERPKAGSFEFIHGKVDGQDAQLQTQRQNDVLDIGVSIDGKEWTHGNHIVELSYVAKNQFVIYSDFEDLNENISGEWEVPIEKAIVEMDFPDGMPPRTSFSAGTDSDSHFQFDCVQTNLPSGVRFETSHPIPPNQRLFISVRFMGRGYFASPDEKRNSLRSFIATHLLLVVIVVGFVIFTVVAYVLAPAGVPENDAAPRWIQKLLIVALPGTAALALRLMYEQTVMTWQDGEQMVGFSLAHAYFFLFLPMLLSVFLGCIGVLAVLSISLARWLRGLPTPKWNWLAAFALCICIGLMSVPYEVWMDTTIRLLGSGRHGESLLMTAAADGKLPLAKVLVEHGVSANTTAGGSTALDVACESRSVGVARLLLANGADINRAPNCANIPSLADTGGRQ